MRNTNTISSTKFIMGVLTSVLTSALTTMLLSSLVFAGPEATMYSGLDLDFSGQMMGNGQSNQGGGVDRMGNMMGGDTSRTGNILGGGYGVGGYSMGGYGMGRYMGGLKMGEFMGGVLGGSIMGYFYGLNLTKVQRQKFRDLQSKLRQSNLSLMTQMMDESDKLGDLFSQEMPNPKDVGKVYESIFSIRRKMIENQLQTHNSIYGLLTEKQKIQLKNVEPYYGRYDMIRR